MMLAQAARLRRLVAEMRRIHIVHFQGKRLVWMRTLSLCIYIIHPMMIIAVRLLAKVAHLQNLLIENSMLHFLMVCFTSVAVSIVATALLEDILRKNLFPIQIGHG